jgi:hypothetical protein
MSKMCYLIYSVFCYIARELYKHIRSPVIRFTFEAIVDTIPCSESLRGIRDLPLAARSLNSYPA